MVKVICIIFATTGSVYIIILNIYGSVGIAWYISYCCAGNSFLFWYGIRLKGIIIFKVSAFYKIRAIKIWKEWLLSDTMKFSDIIL